MILRGVKRRNVDGSQLNIQRECMHVIRFQSLYSTILYYLWSNYEQRHLILSGSDTFLIWTFPQVGNLPLWSLRIIMCETSATYCVSTRTERVLLFRARDVNSRISILHAVQGYTMDPGEKIARAKGSESGKL